METVEAVYPVGEDWKPLVWAHQHGNCIRAARLSVWQTTTLSTALLGGEQGW